MSALPKIVRLIQVLPDKEFKQFELLVASPYFNKKGKLVDLLRCRRSKAESLECLYEELFPDQPLNKQVFRNQWTKITNLYKQFLAHELVKEDQPVMELLAEEKIERMGLREQIPFAPPKIKLEDLGQYSRTAIDLLERSYSRAVDHDRYKSVELSKQQLKQQFLAIQAAYAIKMVDFLCTYYNFKRFYSSNVEDVLIERAFKQFQLETDYLNIPLVRQFWNTLQMYLNGKKPSFLEEKETLLEIAESLHKDHLSDLSSLLVAQCQYFIMHKKEDYFQHMAEIYEIRFKNPLLVHSVEIMNYIKALLRTEPKENLHDLLEGYRSKLTSDDFFYQKGIISIYYEDFESALFFLNQSKPGVESRIINNKQMIAFSLYCLGEMEVALYQTQAFLQYISRASFKGKKSKLGMQNFAKALKQLIDLSMKKESLDKESYQAAFQKLKQRLIDTPYVINKNILLNTMDGRPPYKQRTDV